jgi:hypothetical protein
MITWFKRLLQHLRSTGVRAGAVNPRVPQPPIRPASPTQDHYQVYGRPSQQHGSPASRRPPSPATSPRAQPATASPLPPPSSQRPPCNMDLDNSVPTDAMAALRRTMERELQQDERRRAAALIDTTGISSLLAAAAEADTPTGPNQPFHANPNPTRLRSPSPGPTSIGPPPIPPHRTPERQRATTPPPGPRLPHKERASRPRDYIILEPSNSSPPSSPARTERQRPSSPTHMERYSPYPTRPPPQLTPDRCAPAASPPPQRSAPATPLPNPTPPPSSPQRPHSPTHASTLARGEAPQLQPTPGTNGDHLDLPAAQRTVEPTSHTVSAVAATPPPFPHPPLIIPPTDAPEGQGAPQSPTSTTSNTSVRTHHEQQSQSSRKRPRPNTTPATNPPHGALGRRRGWPNNLLQAWRNAKKRPNIARRMWTRGTMDERKKMFLAASPGLRREILTWGPDVPCTSEEISALTGSLSTPAVFEDPAPLSTQLQDWMRAERDEPYSEPLPSPSPNSPAPDPPAPGEPESISHNWHEGTRIGEASNPGPPQPSEASLPHHLLQSILQQLLTALQQLQPTPLNTNPQPSRRRQERRKPGPTEAGRQPPPERPPHRNGQQQATSSQQSIGAMSPPGACTRPTTSHTRYTWVTPVPRHDRPGGTTSGWTRAPPTITQQDEAHLCQYGSDCLNQPFCPLQHPPPYDSYRQKSSTIAPTSHSRGASKHPKTPNMRNPHPATPCPPTSGPRTGRLDGRGVINHVVDYEVSGQLPLNPSHVGSFSDHRAPRLPSPPHLIISHSNSPALLLPLVLIGLWP